MKNFYIFLTLFVFLFQNNFAYSAACTASSSSDFDCCQADGDTSGTKKTLSDTNESTRICSWPADEKFEFTIKRFGLLPKGGTEADIVYKGGSMVFNAGAVDAGATMGNFIAGADFPAGTYEALVPEIGMTETVQSSTAPTITHGGVSVTCTANSITETMQPGDAEFMCTGQSAVSYDNAGTDWDFTLAVGTFGTDYGPGVGDEGCNIDESGNGVVDTYRFFDNQLGDIVISAETTYSISVNFNTSDGVIYSVFDDLGYGSVTSPVACTAVEVGDLDVTVKKE